MCTLTHFVPHPSAPATVPPAMFPHAAFHAEQPVAPNFQVILAGNAFFHIKEIATGHVRGFRSNHNEACALARALESGRQACT